MAKTAKKTKKKPLEDFYSKWDGYANKRSAWSGYVATMHTIRMETDEDYRKAQKSKPSIMYIG